MPERRVRRVRMSQAPDTRRDAPAAKKPAPAQTSRQPEGPGASESRRRGALLRRLLALCDWGARLASLAVVTAATSATDTGTFFWAVLVSPSWVLVVKLHGLYDNDHRRIRHSTLDELPSLVSASVLGTLVLDGLLAISPAGPLAPASALGLAIGAPKAVDIVARRGSTHPETRLALVGYLSSESEETASELPRLGSPADISRVARELMIERVVVTELQMGEVGAEHLIAECKAEGLALTFLPQHYGLLGPGIELNRLAELPVLDFRCSDPPRSTIAMKRTMDIVISALALVLLSPLLVGVALWILLDGGRPVLFRQRRAGKDGEPFTMVKFRTMVKDAEQRLPDLVDIETLDQPAFKFSDDPRVTRSGRWLRRTSIDELPQLLNVL